MITEARAHEITNEEFRKRIGEEKSILRTIQQRKHNWLGHVLGHDGMLLKILEGRTMDNLRQRERRRIQMIDDIVGQESYGKTKRKAEDRRQWMGDASSRLSLTQTTKEEDYLYRSAHNNNVVQG